MSLSNKNCQCANSGCKYAGNEENTLCSICSKVGPMTKLVRERFIDEYTFTQNKVLNVEAMTFVIANHQLYFVNGFMENSYKLFCYLRENRLFLSTEQAKLLINMRGFPHLWFSLVLDRWNLTEGYAPACYYSGYATRPDLDVSIDDDGKFVFTVSNQWNYTPPNEDSKYGSPINEDDYRNPNNAFKYCCSNKLREPTKAVQAVQAVQAVVDSKDNK